MNIRIHRIWKVVFAGVLLVAIAASAAGNPQDTPKQKLSRDSLMVVARAIIDSADCRAFITVDEHGKPHARAMAVFPLEKNFVVYLGTSPNSRKVKQIRQNPNVIVYFYDTQGMSYVSLIGKARLVDDPEKKAHYWREGWTRWYPDRDKDYILIQVTPERLEMFSFQYQVMGEHPVWTVPSVDF